VRSRVWVPRSGDSGRWPGTGCDLGRRSRTRTHRPLGGSGVFVDSLILVTGNAITAALLEYTTTVTDAENSVTVDIAVLEDNGKTSVHTLLLSPASQFDVADAGGISEGEEADRFPVPDLNRCTTGDKLISFATATHQARAVTAEL
jgi:hypothetical protein